MRRKKPTTPDDETRVGDVQDLRAFVLASDLRSLTAAARVSGESKATLSRRLTRLEKSLGTALLRRSSRGIETTDEGAAYRIRVGEVLELLGDANAAAARGGRAAPSGQLRISIPPGFASALAAPLAGFGAQFPQVTLVVHISSRFVDLEAERFDVAFRATTKLADSSLLALRVNEPQAEGILVAAPSYLDAHPAPRRPADLASHRIVAVGETGAAFSMPLVRRGTGDSIELTLPVAVASSDVGFLKEMVLRGAGITSLPRLSVQDALEDGRLVHVLPSYVWSDVNLYLLYRGGPFVPPKVRVLVDYMRGALDLKRRKPT
ncbi:MAG: Transcriptional regulator, LysR family protein [Labilithrix sp.]|nr:Transcriptional regulator, LysR family protein [Labilithrix sp.]